MCHSQPAEFPGPRSRRRVKVGPPLALLPRTPAPNSIFSYFLHHQKEYICENLAREAWDKSERILPSTKSQKMRGDHIGEIANRTHFIVNGSKDIIARCRVEVLTEKMGISGKSWFSECEPGLLNSSTRRHTNSASSGLEFSGSANKKKNETLTSVPKVNHHLCCHSSVPWCSNHPCLCQHERARMLSLLWPRRKAVGKVARGFLWLRMDEPTCNEVCMRHGLSFSADLCTLHGHVRAYRETLSGSRWHGSHCITHPRTPSVRHGNTRSSPQNASLRFALSPSS